MTPEVFIAKLAKERFPSPILVERKSSGFLDLHAHAYEVHALVIEGQIDITIDGLKNTYLTGDAFHLLFNQTHTENYSTNGVTYLASRKSSAAQEEMSVPLLDA